MAQDQEAAALLAPLRDTLGRVEAQVGGLERDRAEQFGSIHQALRRVESGTGELSRTTANLVGSLRSSTVRGAWGECSCAGCSSWPACSRAATSMSR